MSFGTGERDIVVIAGNLIIAAILLLFGSICDYNSTPNMGRIIRSNIEWRDGD